MGTGLTFGNSRGSKRSAILCRLNQCLFKNFVDKTPTRQRLDISWHDEFTVSVTGHAAGSNWPKITSILKSG
jgi:hypothetical protein